MSVAKFFLGLVTAGALTVAVGAQQADPLGAAQAMTQSGQIGAVSVRPGEVLRGTFVQVRTMKGFDKPLRTEGDFVVAPPYGLIWNAAKPFKTSTVISSSGLVQTNNGVQTLNLSAHKMPFIEQLYRMIGGMLTGDLTAMQKTFTLERSGTPTHWRIRMVPRTAGDVRVPFAEIRASGGRFVEQVTLVKTDGDSDALSFQGVNLTRAPLSAVERTALGVKP